MAREINLYFAPANSGLLLSTNVAGGGAGLVPLANPYPYVFSPFARSITLTSTDNLSAVNFTIVGKDQFGNVQSEVLAGPNNDTVQSLNFYISITSITSSGVWTHFSVGSGTTGFSQWIPVNTLITPPNFSIQTQVSGTINYTINETYGDIEYYSFSGPSVVFNYPKLVELANNPIATTNASAVVVVTVPSTAFLQTGNLLTIVGAATTGTITAAELNITAAITVVSATTFSYISTGTGDGSTGGGANVGFYFPALPNSFAVSGSLTNATTAIAYSDITARSAFQVLINSSTGGSLNTSILQAGIN